MDVLAGTPWGLRGSPLKLLRKLGVLKCEPAAFCHFCFLVHLFTRMGQAMTFAAHRRIARQMACWKAGQPSYPAMSAAGQMPAAPGTGGPTCQTCRELGPARRLARSRPTSPGLERTDSGRRAGARPLAGTAGSTVSTAEVTPKTGEHILQ